MATTTLQQATQIRVVSGLDVVAGLWLMLAPFIFDYSANGGSIANDMIVGAAVLLLAGYEMFGENYRLSAPSWVNVLLGIWLIATPFVLNFASGSAAMWNDIVLGVIVGCTALFNALSTPEESEG